MDEIIRIGLDTSKQNFQLHGVNAAEEPVLRRKLRRTQMMAVTFTSTDALLHWPSGTLCGLIEDWDWATYVVPEQSPLL